MTQLCKEIK